MRSFGWKTTHPMYGNRGIIEKPDSTSRSASGNLILRAGDAFPGDNGWQSSVHIVLTPEEAAEFIAALQKVMAK